MDFKRIFKFNDNHDPSNGEFSSGGGSSSGAPKTKERSLHDVAEDIINDSFWSVTHDHPEQNTGKGAEAPHLDALLAFAKSNEDEFDNLDSKDQALANIDGVLATMTWYTSDKSKQFKDELIAIRDRLKALPEKDIKHKLYPRGTEHEHTDEQG